MSNVLAVSSNCSSTKISEEDIENALLNNEQITTEELLSDLLHTHVKTRKMNNWKSTMLY